MVKASLVIGVISGIVSIALWGILIFFNPYTLPTDIEPMISTFFMLLLPAVLVIISSIFKNKTFLLVAFFWSVPMSIYLSMTPGIFSVFGVTCFCYLVTFICMRGRVIATYNQENERWII